MINRRSLRHWRVDLFELFWLDGKSAKNGDWLWLRWILLAHLYVIFAFIHLMFHIMVLWIMGSRWMLFFDTKNSNDTASPSDQCITYINPYFVLLLLLSRLFHSNFYRFLLHATMKHKCCYCTRESTISRWCDNEMKRKKNGTKSHKKTIETESIETSNKRINESKWIRFSKADDTQTHLMCTGINEYG